MPNDENFEDAVESTQQDIKLQNTILNILKSIARPSPSEKGGFSSIISTS